MTLIDEYQQQAAALSADTVAQVAAIYAALQAGKIIEAEAVQLIAAVIAMANAGAATLADAYISAQIETAVGIPTPTTGFVPADDTDRLVLASRTILDDFQASRLLADSVITDSSVADENLREIADTAGTRLQRLARAEPLEAAQRTSIEILDAQPMVEGWTRQMDGDPCQLCRWWWREGRVWPKNHRFQSHKGCNCQPKVVVAQHIKPTEYTRKLERNRK